MKNIDYHRPSSFDEACRLLAQSGGQMKALAGGTDLLVLLKQGVLKPDGVVSLKDVPELSFVYFKAAEGLAIGATTPLGLIESTPGVKKRYPAIAEAAATIGSVQVRNRGTLGGNICNAAPSADSVPILIAYGAEAVIGDGQGERSVLLEKFFTGPGQTVLAPGELLKAVKVPPPPDFSFGIYLKSSRTALDLAQVGVAALVVFDKSRKVVQELRLVLGAVGPTVFRAKKTEALAAGQKLEDDLIEKVSQKAAAEARPITDVRATASYRKTLVGVSAKRALLAARDWARKGGAR